MDVYAIVEDVTAWPVTTDLAGDIIDRYLRSASILVARACNRDLYAGLTGSDIPPALRDATVSQVATWIELGIDPATLGLGSAPVKKSTILGADIERDTAGQFAAQQAAVAQLGPEPTAILLSAGLLWQPAPLTDDNGGLLPLWGRDPHLPLSPYLANSTDWPFQ